MVRKTKLIKQMLNLYEMIIFFLFNFNNSEAKIQNEIQKYEKSLQAKSLMLKILYELIAEQRKRAHQKYQQIEENFRLKLLISNLKNKTMYLMQSDNTTKT